MNSVPISLSAGAGAAVRDGSKMFHDECILLSKGVIMKQFALPPPALFLAYRYIIEGMSAPCYWVSA